MVQSVLSYSKALDSLATQNSRMLKRVWQLITSTFSIWSNANASRMSAALTYYAMLSLAPLLMIAIAIAGYVYDDQLAQAEVLEQVELMTSPAIADQVARLIKNAVAPGSGLVAGSISLCVFVFAASGVVTQIYDTFNDIWNVTPNYTYGILFTIQKRLLGVGMVLLVGVMLTAALGLNSAFAYVNTLVEGQPTLLGWLNLADRSLTFLLMPFIFSLVFWFFPATKIQWRDVWPAGILTAFLIGASRYLVGIYLEFSTTSEVYGVSGSLVVLLIWIYMLGLVVFFGASFSHAWADTFGSRSELAKEGASNDSEVESETELSGRKSTSRNDSKRREALSLNSLLQRLEAVASEAEPNEQADPLNPRRRS